MTRLPVTERRRQLVEAAKEVVRRNGVAGVTTRAVVDQANMPLGAFHYVFASRDELLGAVAESVAIDDRLAAEGALDSIVPGIDGLGEALAAGIDLFVSHLVTHPYDELAFLELALYGARQDLDDKQTRRRYDVTYAHPEYLLARAATASGTEWSLPVREVARILVGALDGLTLAYLADHDADAARRTGAFYATSLVALAREAGSGFEAGEPPQLTAKPPKTSKEQPKVTANWEGGIRAH